MAPITTYVFFGLGTTGLPDTDPEITELHMIAFKCNDLRRYFREGGKENLATRRELHRRREDNILLCISQEDSDECSFLVEAVLFLEYLEKPVCLIAHNGNKFGFPLLLAKLKHFEDFSPKDFVCADSMAAFYDIMEPNAEKTSYEERKRRSFPWPDYHNIKVSYRLEDIFKRVCGTQDVLKGAEDRNNALAKMALIEGFEFMHWVSENNHPLTAFKKKAKV